MVTPSGVAISLLTFMLRPLSRLMLLGLLLPAFNLLVEGQGRLHASDLSY